MRTIAAYLTGLLLCLLWITTGGGLSVYAPAPDYSAIVSDAPQVRAGNTAVHIEAPNEITFSDLQQNISLFEHPNPVRVGTPERTTGAARPHSLTSGGTVTPDTGLKSLLQVFSRNNGHSVPILSGGAAVDYYIYALRKILI